MILKEKFILLVMVTMLVVILCACGKDKEIPGESSEERAESIGKEEEQQWENIHDTFEHAEKGEVI